MTSDPASSSNGGAAAAVKVLARYPLRCADESSLRHIASPWRLGPFDQAVPPVVPIPVIFAFEQPAADRGAATSEQLIPIERLLRALARVLDYYPQLTGRIAVNPHDQAPEIDRLGTGAELVSAQCDAPLDAFRTTTTTTTTTDAADADEEPRLRLLNLPDAGNALLPPFEPTMEGVCRDPILTVQHTLFACGGVTLGVRLLHTVCDADGFFQFVRDLAELYRALRAADQITASDASGVQLRHPPHIKPYLADLSTGMQPDERKAALEFKPSVFELVPTPPAQAATEAPPTEESTSPLTATPPITGRVIRFSARELEALKAEANETRSSSGEQLSTFDALSAHLWQSVYRARLQLCESQGMSATEAALHLSSDFLTSVNWRGRLELPARYFPNCVFAPFFSLPADRLADGPLASVAAAVHEAVRSLSRQEALQSLRWLAAQPNKRQVKLGFSFEKASFLVSQWCKFDMYRGVELDSLPTLVTMPFTPISLIDGLTYLLATEEQLRQTSPAAAASIDVNMALSHPLWAILEQDARFRRHCKQEQALHFSPSLTHIHTRPH